MQRIADGCDVENRFSLKLEPCPFCGSRNIGLYISHNPHITCMSCKADGPYIDGSESLDYKQYQACIKWNRRNT